MNPSLRTAVLQFGPTADSERNRADIARLVESAATQGARLAILPEEAMVLAEALDEPLEDVVLRDWPAFLAHLSALAARFEVWIIAGGYEPNTDGRPFNTIVVVGPSGEIRDSYRKLHLYDAFSYSESDYVTAGTAVPPVVLVEGVAVGLVNCYDIRFPELARDLVDRGADLLSVSAAWVAGARKEDHWTTLLRARAIENTCWVAASGTTSPGCIGLSTIIDPLGVERAALGSVAEGVAVIDVSLEQTASVRDILPALANRRLVSTVTVKEHLS